MTRFQLRMPVCPAGILLLAATFGATPSHATVTISSAATSNMSCASGVCTPTAANAVLNVGDLESMLASGDVAINTGTGSLAQQVEDIVVAASFNWANGSALTLDAYRSVIVTSPVAANGVAPVSLITNDGGSGGNLFFISGGNLSFLGTTNALSINRKTYALENSIAALAAAIEHKPSGRYALSASYNAGSDGTYKDAPIPTKFKGVFNGLGNSVANLSISGGEKNVGLFAYVEAGGAINSLMLANANVRARTGTSAGTAVGINYGTVFNDSASGQVTGVLGPKFTSPLGGLIGNNHGTIVSSSASSQVTAASKSNKFGLGYLGGLTGLNDGTLANSYSTGGVSATGENTDVTLGGLVGDNGGLIENCYAEGNATVAEYAQTGGLVGLTDSSITDSYSTGSPAGKPGDVGGFAGYDDSKGGLSGDYWDTTTSGITNLSDGAGNIANDPGITGQTTAQLQAGLPAGFDPTIWAENPSINGGLPYLIANPPQ
jgi:hypothetical protein